MTRAVSMYTNKQLIKPVSIHHYEQHISVFYNAWYLTSLSCSVDLNVVVIKCFDNRISGWSLKEHLKYAFS